MSTDLNERGLRDGLATMADIKKTVSTMAAESARRMGEAEAHYLAMTKLLGFVDSHIAELRGQLNEVERKKEQT